MAYEDNGSDIVRRFQRAKSDRATWESHWRDVARYCNPTREFLESFTPGAQRNRQIYNDTAPNARMTLASALHGYLVNPSIVWAMLGPETQNDSLDEDAHAWLYDCSLRMLAFLGRSSSGFPTAAFEVCDDLVTFGTAIQLRRETPTALTFQARDLASFYMVENHAGEIVEQYALLEMTIREAVDEFGLENLHDETRRLAESESGLDMKIQIIHAVCKRENYDPGRRDGPNRPWSSAYVEFKSKHMIGKVGGFASNPYATPRWSKAPRETYGRSPSMNSLPTIRTLNAVERTNLQAGELKVRPPIMAPAGLMEGPISTIPGSINYYKRGASQLPTALNTGVDAIIGNDIIERYERKIEQAFFLDALSLPDIDRMTAEEVITRRQQGLMKASPILSRLYAEWLEPTFVSVFDWMQRAGHFSPPPDSVRRTRLRVYFVSPMALSQRASEGENFMSAMRLLTPLAATDASVMMNIDADEAARGLVRGQNVNPRYLRPRQAVAAMRKQQVQRDATAQTLEGAATAAAAGRDAAAAVKDYRSV